MKLSKRIFTALMVFCGLAVSSPAQTGLFTTVRVFPTTAGGTFYVDGVPYTSGQIFRWQVGDTHTIRIQSPFAGGSTVDPLNQGIPGQVATDAGLGTRYAFTGQMVFNTASPATSCSENQTVPAQDLPCFDLTTVSPGQILARLRVWPTLTQVELVNVKQHVLRIRSQSAGCAPAFDPLNNPLPGACGPVPGYVDVVATNNEDCVIRATNGDYWCAEGSAITLLAVPAVGYAFNNWTTQPGIGAQINGGGYGYAQFTLLTPFHMNVQWGPGKFYRLVTDPAGLEVVVDRAIIRTRTPEPLIQSLCNAYLTLVNDDGNPTNVGQGGDNAAGDSYCTVWPFNSTRLLAAPDLQRDRFNKPWVFEKIVNTGLGQNSNFTVAGEQLATNTITWKFVPAASVSFLTQPQLNLPIIVNNRTWPSNFFHFGLNREFTFTAPAESVSPDGRRWRFAGWSNGGTATQTIQVTDEMVKNGLTLIANYVPLNKLSIETNPVGLPVFVDGVECAHPCLLDRLAGESVTVSTAPSVTQRDVLRLEFDNWNDGGPTTRTVDFGPDARRLVANYRQNYRLSAISNPPEGADFSFDPASPDNFYPLNTRVNVTVTPKQGFKFREWAGDTAGRFPTAGITIGGPRGVVAELNTVPFVEPAGVKNAAGTGPQDEGEMGRVAPGSLISITGANLTPKEETGPLSPQAQSLADVVVRVNERYLPLSFASGSLISAQLPYDLPLGKHKLSVLRVGQDEVNAEFEAVRNAPGLFGRGGTEGEGIPPLGYALRPDGSVVTPENPARANEVISLQATGLGPYRFNPPIGFAIPAGNTFLAADTVEVLVGDQVVQPLRVLATVGQVGMTSVEIRLGAQFPAGQSTTLRLRVNGKESNAVRLDVR